MVINSRKVETARNSSWMTSFFNIIFFAWKMENTLYSSPDCNGNPFSFRCSGKKKIGMKAGTNLRKIYSFSAPKKSKFYSCNLSFKV